MRVKFLVDKTVQDSNAGTNKETKFLAGRSYELAEPSAVHWISRGAAVAADDEQPQTPSTPPVTESQNSPTVPSSRANNPAEDSVDTLTGRDEKVLVGQQTDEQREKGAREAAAKEDDKPPATDDRAPPANVTTSAAGKATPAGKKKD